MTKLLKTVDEIVCFPTSKDVSHKLGWTRCSIIGGYYPPLVGRHLEPWRYLVQEKKFSGDFKTAFHARPDVSKTLQAPLKRSSGLKTLPQGRETNKPCITSVISLSVETLCGQGNLATRSRSRTGELNLVAVETFSR